jgi:molybdopterin-containing oxidoreductase family iron-sulfur binding subunit
MADKKEMNNEYTNLNYWRSFEELYGDKEAIQSKLNEFQSGVTDEFDVKNLSGISRRKFLALLGASAALAGAGCSDYHDKGEIVPYNKKPEEISIGKANHYASTCTGCNHSCGILIKTREGRPIKVDGNPDHPISKGKICAKGQSNILNLYDPARISEPLAGKKERLSKSSWKKVDNEIIAALKFAGSKEVAVICHSVTSPTFATVIEKFKTTYPTAKFYFYELFQDETKLAAWNNCYGLNTLPVIEWDNAKVILSLEGDFLGVDGNKIEQTAAFTKNRDVDDLASFNRLYVAEGNLSLTGMNADYRFRLRPDNQYEFVMSLLNEIIRKHGTSIAISLKANQAINNFSLEKFASKYELPLKEIYLLVEDLVSNKGRGIVYAGRSLSTEVHVAVNLLNEVLGNTVLYKKDVVNQFYYPLTSSNEWKNLVDNMNAGKVAAVIHVDTNPVYHLPVELNYSASLEKVPVVVSLTDMPGETSAVSSYVLPVHHNFESWGDARVRSGYYSLLQPVIAPLYNTRQKEGILLNWTNSNPKEYTEKTYLEFIKKNWEEKIYLSFNTPFMFEKFWQGALHDGVVQSKEQVFTSYSLSGLAADNLPAKVESSNGIVIQLTENAFIGDGRFANNGWLQELPHPVSKVTWDNYAAISEKTAKKLGVKTNDLISIKTGNAKLEIAVLVQAGIADDLINIELGYGRTDTPIIAAGVGFNANLLMDSNSKHSRWLIDNVKVEKANGRYFLATTQEHHAFDDTLIQDAHLKRHIIQEGTVAEYNRNRKFLKEKPKPPHFTLYKEFEYKAEKWAMAIDLNKCTGCSECVAACNVENNIPVIGKDQVRAGREMQWLRLDRYYSGTPDNPKVSIQPMLCQHCDHAPCENVCPVVATTHSPDGLNQMVYNRCVGTRYCSNNCPYKVRRFNFFDFRNNFANGYYEQPSLELIHNPEVTVRSRGVMEKCTFCVQRIMEVRNDAVSEGKQLKDYEIKTACQEACPAEAIKFGDMNNPESEISNYRKHDLSYIVLEELNVTPNVTYLAKLKNTHSEEA